MVVEAAGRLMSCCDVAINPLEGAWAVWVDEAGTRGGGLRHSVQVASTVPATPTDSLRGGGPRRSAWMATVNGAAMNDGWKPSRTSEAVCGSFEAHHVGEPRRPEGPSARPEPRRRSISSTRPTMASLTRRLRKDDLPYFDTHRRRSSGTLYEKEPAVTAAAGSNRSTESARMPPTRSVAVRRTGTTCCALPPM